MGMDFRDHDNDWRPDIVFTPLTGETFPLFRNHGNGEFRDGTYRGQVGPLTNQRSGWGIGAFDRDNDGWKVLFSANVHDTVEIFEAAEYKLTNSVFVNAGDGAFRDVSGDADAEFQRARAHRGAPFANFNHDGKIDVVVTALGEPAELWKNTSPEENTRLVLKVIGTRTNRNGFGACIWMGLPLAVPQR